MDTSRERRRNKPCPDALKQEIGAATFEPGASGPVVARPYDINANQALAWRRRFGEASKPPAALAPTCGLVAVMIAPEPGNEIEVAGDWRVRVGASCDARALERVLDILRQR